MATPFFFYEEEVGPQTIPIDHNTHNSTFIRDEVPWSLINRVTGQFPAFVHFNGEKSHLDWQWERLWWGGGQGIPVMQRINDYLTTNVSIPIDNGYSIPFRQLCPRNWQMP